MLDGRLETTTVHNFEVQIHSLFTLNAPDITLDCGGLSYVSSAGLRILLVLQKSVSLNNGTLVFKNMLPVVREVFDMTGFSSIFTIE